MSAAFQAAFRAGDVEALVALYEPGAVLAPAPGARAEGHAAIRAAIAQFMALRGTMTLRTVTCMRAGELAFVESEWTLVYPGEGGKTQTMGARTAEVLRRQPNGTWKYVIDHAFGSDRTP